MEEGGGRWRFDISCSLLIRRHYQLVFIGPDVHVNRNFDSIRSTSQDCYPNALFSELVECMSYMHGELTHIEVGYKEVLHIYILNMDNRFKAMYIAHVQVAHSLIFR